jgi:hypothetical protein
MSPKDRRTAERLVELVRAFRVLEIRQSLADFVSDKRTTSASHIDGKKHTRETP